VAHGVAALVAISVKYCHGIGEVVAASNQCTAGYGEIRRSVAAGGSAARGLVAYLGGVSMAGQHGYGEAETAAWRRGRLWRMKCGYSALMGGWRKCAGVGVAAK